MLLKRMQVGLQRERDGRSATDPTGAYVLLVKLSAMNNHMDSSCFNAFSRVDVRVEVKIPGGVHAYVVDLRGERYVVLFPA